MIIGEINKAIKKFSDTEFEQVNLGLNLNIKEIKRLIPLCNKAAVYRGVILGGKIENIYLISNVFGPPGREEYRFAVKSNSPNIARYILKECCDIDATKIAVEYDNRAIFEWAMNSGQILLGDITGTIYVYDSVECYSYLRDNYPYMVDFTRFQRAIACGCSRILRYELEEVAVVPYDRTLCDMAIVYGQLDILKYLYSKGYHWNSEALVEVIIGFPSVFINDLSVVDYQKLRKNRIKCVKWAKKRGYTIEIDKVRNEIEVNIGELRKYSDKIKYYFEKMLVLWDIKSG